VPEVSAVPGGLTPPARANRPLAEIVAEAFSADGTLASTLHDFEPRAGQAEMAAAVAQTIEDGGILLAQAGTGTGKTLAYLVPAILSRQRVLVSTGTKNLQEQIYFKDIPALRDALDVPFTATYMKGRANYLCLHRLDQVMQGAEAAVHDVFLPIVREWAARTDTGDRAELEDLPENLAFWNEIAATSDTCLGTECPQYDACFITRMRQRAAASDVVIVNHHLLCADAAVRQSAYGEVIPSCGMVIIDEAHQLEDIVTQYFGRSFSNYRVDDLVHDAERLAATTETPLRRAVERALDALREHAPQFFADLAYAHRTPGRTRFDDRIRVTESSLFEAREAGGRVTAALDALESACSLVALARAPNDEAPDADADETPDDAAALVRRCGELRSDLRQLLRADDPEYVHFVEFRGKGVFLRACPIDVSGIVREHFLDRMRTTVLTSATLTVDDSFNYLRTRLGIGRATEVRLASEFDFSQQAILYLPKRMPDPRTEEFALAAGREIVEIVKRTQGRAFVLFTSYATLRSVQAIAEMALDYPLLVQGTAPRTQLLRQFRETPHAVLFATASFWQGVDVVGEALSCVIIDKLPFASPADPVTAARIDAVRAAGGEPFGEYQVPLAILALQQGLGRLIRHRRDRGVLVVLDPRLRTKGYGRRFLGSLPNAPVVHELAAVERFFSIV